MYSPTHFAETDERRLTQLIQKNAFGLLLSHANGPINASHLPFIYDEGKQLLLGHIARANPHWRSLDGSEQALVIFQGPHAYVSPSWYLHDGVPTWNYATVHMRGRASTFEDPELLRTVVQSLAAQYEASQVRPWHGQFAPRKLRMIVGIRFAIESIQGKFKLSQNRSAAERAAVIDQLSAQPSDYARGVARLMQDLGALDSGPARD